MLHKKTGYPEEGELVICTVTKVMPNSVFVNLDEYDRRSAMIHISEIAPGRIRNIREYVEEGKMVVCKVININMEKGYIDLSLRRVSDSMKRSKIDLVKQEQKAEKIVEAVAKKLKLKPESVFEQVSKTILAKYSSLYEAFEAISFGSAKMSDFVLDKTIADALYAIIEDKIKPAEVSIDGELTLSSVASDGVEVVKSALSKAEKDPNTKVIYLGGGKFKMKVTAPDYKAAEKILKEDVDYATEYIEKHEGTAEFARTEK